MFEQTIPAISGGIRFNLCPISIGLPLISLVFKFSSFNLPVNNLVSFDIC
jgi:hypothetical protein